MKKLEKGIVPVFHHEQKKILIVKTDLMFQEEFLYNKLVFLYKKKKLNR